VLAPLSPEQRRQLAYYQLTRTWLEPQKHALSHPLSRATHGREWVLPEFSYRAGIFRVYLSIHAGPTHEGVDIAPAWMVAVLKPDGSNMLRPNQRRLLKKMLARMSQTGERALQGVGTEIDFTYEGVSRTDRKDLLIVLSKELTSEETSFIGYTPPT
jgi:hypothetical protein